MLFKYIVIICIWDVCCFIFLMFVVYFKIYVIILFCVIFIVFVLCVDLYEL